jgi:hypothetical protein
VIIVSIAAAGLIVFLFCMWWRASGESSANKNWMEYERTGKANLREALDQRNEELGAQRAALADECDRHAYLEERWQVMIDEDRRRHLALRDEIERQHELRDEARDALELEQGWSELFQLRSREYAEESAKYKNLFEAWRKKARARK